MACGCLPRIFRKASQTCPLFEIVDATLSRASDNAHTKSETVEKPSPEDSDPQPPPAEEKTIDAALPTTHSTESVKERDEKLPSAVSIEKKGTERYRWNGAPFFRNLFRTPQSEETALWIRCDFEIDEINSHVRLKLKSEKWSEDVSVKGNRGQTAGSIPFMFLIRGRKKEDEISEIQRSRHPSSSTKSETESDEPIEANRPKERSVFCLRWGTAEAVDDEDEAITLIAEAPPGLSGLANLGNTCFLNAALQCLRCTPGFVGLVVPELKNGFEGVERYQIIDDPDRSKRQRNRSHSSSLLWAQRISPWKCEGTLQRRSLPVVLPYEIGGRLDGHTGLAGGSVQRLSSVPNLLIRELEAYPSTSNVQSYQHPKDIMPTDNAAFSKTAEESGKGQPELNAQTNNNASSGNAHVPTRDTKSSATPSETQTEQPSTSNNASKGEASTKEESETELSQDFISAFRKLVVEVCRGDAEHHRNPRDLYQQLKKLPQGEWFCDGGQHDCQEVTKFLLDAIHANYIDLTIDRPIESFGRCISDVSSDVMDALHVIEVENLKSNSLWKQYLSSDASPVTDVFAGQVQIVRSCQKCHCRSTTYEPFWDLSLSLSRERSSWFNPGRMPSSLDDLLRAFTAAEVLQGEEAPFCECCDQKSPATRRILIHRFPKVLVINIKRFKYTKDGREKLTSNISFPMRALRLQNFASKEYLHGGLTELYDLYAVSNHYGTLGGGHYIAYCKVKDKEGKDGWYSFNDKAVNKIANDAVVTPNAYILFYAKRLPDCTLNEV